MECRTGASGGPRLVVGGVDSDLAGDVLRLLNEDLFSGGFSQQHYAASAKRTIK